MRRAKAVSIELLSEPHSVVYIKLNFEHLDCLTLRENAKEISKVSDWNIFLLSEEFPLALLVIQTY